MIGARHGKLLALLVVGLLAPATAWSQQCLIASSDLVSGGIGKDAIPALQNPAVVTPEQADLFLRPGDTVLGVVMNGVARAYPHPILWWHEIINDNLGGVPIAVTYCPLTGSGIVYDPVLDGEAITFGTSGLLFDNNLVMYDRGRDESLWSQMMQLGICGPREGYEPGFYPVSEMSWGAWKALHPETTAVSDDTGWDRDYRRYPYGPYADIENTVLLYPHSFIDPRLPMKALVHGVEHDGLARAYALDRFAAQGQSVVVNDVIGNRAVLIVYDGAARTVLSFDRKLRVQKRNGKWKNRRLAFEIVDSGEFPFLLRDRQTKTLWTLEGVPIEGKLVGKVEGGGMPRIPEAYTSFWFAWASFHRGTELH